jgi:hypothetical protein
MDVLVTKDKSLSYDAKINGIYIFIDTTNTKSKFNNLTDRVMTGLFLEK